MSRCCDSKRIQRLNGCSYPLRQKRATRDTYFPGSRQAGSRRARIGPAPPHIQYAHTGQQHLGN